MEFAPHLQLAFGLGTLAGFQGKRSGHGSSFWYVGAVYVPSFIDGGTKNEFYFFCTDILLLHFEVDRVLYLRFQGQHEDHKYHD